MQIPSLKKPAPRTALLSVTISLILFAGALSFVIFQELSTRNEFTKQETAGLLEALVKENIQISNGKISIKSGALNPAPTPPSEAAASQQTQETLRARYEAFAKNSTYGEKVGAFSTVNTYPLLVLFFLALGALSGALGSLLTLIRRSASILLTRSHYLRHYTQPLLGAFVCVLTGFILVGIASTDKLTLPGFEFSYAFLSIPTPVYIISFIFSFEPLRSLVNLTGFVSSQARIFFDPPEDGNPQAAVDPQPGLSSVSGTHQARPSKE